MTPVTVPDYADGVWVVTTKSSQYILNMNARTVVRFPKSEGEDEFTVADLRKDRDWVTLLKVELCQEGLPMQLICVGIADDDDVVTYRQTTPVVAIERLRENND